MRIKITADSTCDLSPELLERYQITLQPLTVTLGGNAYQDGVTIRPDDIFAHVAQGGELPATSAVNIADYQEFFAPLSAQYDAVIHINIGQEFSSCYQNACVAAEEFGNVFPVDSANLSTGQGLVVVEAAEAALRGDDAQTILEMLRALVGRVDTTFVVDKLDYLAKGGRCSSVAALGANLLKLKPCIVLSDGKMAVGKKYRGAWEKVLPVYVEDRLNGRDICKDRIFITHTACDHGVVDAIRAQLETLGFGEILETVAGCTVSCHCGPNTLGVLFIRK